MIFRISSVTTVSRWSESSFVVSSSIWYNILDLSPLRELVSDVSLSSMRVVLYGSISDFGMICLICCRRERFFSNISLSLGRATLVSVVITSVTLPPRQHKNMIQVLTSSAAMITPGDNSSSSISKATVSGIQTHTRAAKMSSEM